MSLPSSLFPFPLDAWTFVLRQKQERTEEEIAISSVMLIPSGKCSNSLEKHKNLLLQ